MASIESLMITYSGRQFLFPCYVCISYFCNYYIEKVFKSMYFETWETIYENLYIYHNSFQLSGLE